MAELKVDKKLAIAMWDFSWLERRWDGAGYEDWDKILEELKERGYDAVRIDVYPHLLHTDPDKEWTLLPVWYYQTWGSPAINKVTVKENLKEFLTKCKEHGLKVGLSTWFRVDEDNVVMNIKTPEDHAAVWKTTLDFIAGWGLLDNILYVDLCNEFPLNVWAPFLEPVLGTAEPERRQKEIFDWMRVSIEELRKSYNNIPLCYSFTGLFDDPDEDISFMDLLELHIWMASTDEYYEMVGYNYERYELKGYENIVLNAERVYKERPEYWKNCLKEAIEKAAKWSKKSGKPIITTECWGVVDYKDWPLLKWDWVKELCEFGVEEAVKTGKWAAMATSNFCGPQFAGMWPDIEWHKRLTDLIHNS